VGGAPSRRTQAAGLPKRPKASPRGGPPTSEQDHNPISSRTRHARLAHRHPVGGAPSRRTQATPASKAKAFAPRRASHTEQDQNPISSRTRHSRLAHRYLWEARPRGECRRPPASKAKAFAPRRASHTEQDQNPINSRTRHPPSTPLPVGGAPSRRMQATACQQSQSLRPEPGLPHRSKITTRSAQEPDTPA